MGAGENRARESNGEKGRTTVTEQQQKFYKEKYRKQLCYIACCAFALRELDRWHVEEAISVGEWATIM